MSKDINGVTIEVGQRVAFGVREGNRASLRMGTVAAAGGASHWKGETYFLVRTDGQRNTTKVGSELAVVFDREAAARLAGLDK